MDKSLAFADAIRQMLGSPKMRYTFGAHAADRHGQQYSLTAMITGFERLYDQAAAGIQNIQRASVSRAE